MKNAAMENVLTFSSPPGWPPRSTGGARKAAYVLAKSGISSYCGIALIGPEQASLTPQQQHMVNGNASTRTSSTVSWRTGSLDQCFNNRVGCHARLDLAHLTLGKYPPCLIGLTKADDPLCRNALFHKASGAMIRRHNVAVYVVHELETEADCASRLEVTGLYPGQKRVDTHDIVANTSEAMATDVHIVCPSTAACVRADTVKEAIEAAEKERHDSTTRGNDTAADGSVLSLPSLFIPSGRIGPAA